ncbi:hypothetical protein FRX31_015782 [Thalictrum thalictroides]|uniref:Uncharacterized protein n=1 Tax=Thalictrum thalictroides TaxID=46969 RepID=A0A7J6WBD9_THATH|nr:hypothetical protein FRX31_015782 [Thalictrum thalictroides]
MYIEKETHQQTTYQNRGFYINAMEQSITEQIKDSRCFLLRIKKTFQISDMPKIKEVRGKAHTQASLFLALGKVYTTITQQGFQFHTQFLQNQSLARSYLSLFISIVIILDFRTRIDHICGFSSANFTNQMSLAEILVPSLANAANRFLILHPPLEILQYLLGDAMRRLREECSKFILDNGFSFGHKGAELHNSISKALKICKMGCAHRSLYTCRETINNTSKSLLSCPPFPSRSDLSSRSSHLSSSSFLVRVQAAENREYQLALHFHFLNFRLGSFGNFNSIMFIGLCVGLRIYFYRLLAKVSCRGKVYVPLLLFSDWILMDW